MKFDGAELPPVKSLVLFDFTEESLKGRSKRPNSLHELAVPISLLPQHSWWGLVLAETCPVQVGDFYM